MLNDSQPLKWGDPDSPEDDDAVVYLCSAAADEITTLRASLDSARELLGETSRFFTCMDYPPKSLVDRIRAWLAEDGEE